MIPVRHPVMSTFFGITILIILIIAACSTNNVSAATSAKDSPCSSGITLLPVRVNDDSVSERYRAFIAQPNEGCDVPAQFCISMSNSFGSGGLSCTTDIPQK